MKKVIYIVVGLVLTGCASFDTNKDYQIYAEQTAKIVAATNASEAACFLVIAEGVKTGDSAVKAAITTQIEKCKKPPPKIEPPRKSWFEF
jgi:hypothetical protein